MKRHIGWATTVLALGLAGGLGSAAMAQQGETGSAADAKTMLERAIVAVKADEAAALEKFRKREDGFGYRDLYVFCNGLDGKTVAHPNPAMAGTDLNTLKDSNGKEFGKVMLSEAGEGQISTVDYVFPRLGGTQPLAKESYFTKVGTLICGVGFHK
ncbi:MAG TPA: cache domain-containing protein [Ancylobacter sp.]